MEIWRKYPISI